MKVYVITRGDYSDYHIIGVSLDKEKARNVARIFSDDMYTANVEEYDSDQFKDAKYPLWDVTFCSNRPVVINKADYCSDYNVPKIVESFVGTQGVWVCQIRVQAEDKDHALKIASDELAKYKAEKEGM